MLWLWQGSPLDMFNAQSSGLLGLNSKCKTCSGRAHAAWSARRGKEFHLSSTYGLSLDEWHAMLARQSGACAICRIEFSATPCVDHCHATGKVRGLLCRRCNRGIGLFRDNVAVIENARRYLKDHELVGGAYG